MEAERQEELRAEWAEMEDRRVLEMLDFGFRMYRAGARGVGERLSNTYRDMLIGNLPCEWKKAGI